MKPFLLFTFLLIVITGSAIAQEQEPAPIRETLFGKDYKNQMQQQNGNQRKAPDAKKTATSTRALIFTDYHQPTTSGARRVNTAKQTGGKALPSDISAKDAASKAPKPAIIKPPVPEQDPSTTPEAKSAPAAKKN